MTELLLLLLQELLRGSTKPRGHYHWKVIRRLRATSPLQTASPPFPVHMQGWQAQEGREGGRRRCRKEGAQPLPQKSGNELERGGWSSAKADCMFFKGGFLSGYKVCPSPHNLFFFSLSFIHELLTILFSKSVYPNDLSLL